VRVRAGGAAAEEGPPARAARRPHEVDLSIAIVTWNTRELVCRCIASALRDAAACAPRVACELILVDNGSDDGTAEAVAARHPAVRVLRLARNEGFAAGANRGLAAARGRLALLLNSDARLLPGAIARCVAYLDAHPDVGVVSPALVREDGRARATAHRFPGLASEILPPGLLAWLSPRRFPSWRSFGPEPADVEAVRGAALFLRTELVARIGPLPEAYFFFLEETEWCWRVRAAGWRIALVPGARVVHLSGASGTRRSPALARIEYHRSLYRFFVRRRGIGRAAVVWMLRFGKSLVRVLLGAPLALASPRLRARWRVQRAVLAWHLRGCPAGVGLARLSSGGRD
jgi:GT2 family glycosyltransferase